MIGGLSMLSSYTALCRICEFFIELPFSLSRFYLVEASPMLHYFVMLLIYGVIHILVPVLLIVKVVPWKRIIIWVRNKFKHHSIKK